MTHKPTIHEATQRVKWLKQDLAKAEQALEDAWARQTPAKEEA